MASDIYEDIERCMKRKSFRLPIIDVIFSNGVDKSQDRGVATRILKKEIANRSKGHFGNFSNQCRFDRLNEGLEIEKIYKEVIEKSHKKLETVDTIRLLVDKYIIKIDEMLSQFREKMGEEYPIISAQIDLNQCQEDSTEHYSGAVCTEINVENEFPIYSELIPSYSNQKKRSAGTTANNNKNSCSSASSSSQLPPLTALKQAREKKSAYCVGNKSVNTDNKGGKIHQKTATKNKMKQKNSSNFDPSSLKGSSYTGLQQSAGSANSRKRKVVGGDKKEVNLKTLLSSINNKCTAPNEKHKVKAAMPKCQVSESAEKLVVDSLSVKTDVTAIDIVGGAAVIGNINTPTAVKEYGGDSADAMNDTEIFCHCKQPSYGEMICCDSDSCNISWFHLECVGLKTAPDGEWFCSNCAVSTAQKVSPPPVPQDGGNDVGKDEESDDLVARG